MEKIFTEFVIDEIKIDEEYAIKELYDLANQGIWGNFEGGYIKIEKMSTDYLINAYKFVKLGCASDYIKDAYLEVFEQELKNRGINIS